MCLIVQMQLTWLTGVGLERGVSGVGFFFFSYFPSLKPRYFLWSGASYSPKIWYIFYISDHKLEICLMILRLSKGSLHN